MQDIHISTHRTTIRPFTPADAPDVFANISTEITRFMTWEPPATETAFAEVWHGWPKAMQEGSEFHFIARFRDGNRFLGIVGVHAARSETPELGIWIRRDAHGRGLGRELIGAVIQWATNALSCRYFVYPVAEENIASRRIAEAYGGQVNERGRHPKYRSVVYHIPPARV